VRMAPVCSERARARLLLDAFNILNRAEVPYCVLHGYEGYPYDVTSDVDCIVSAAFPCTLAARLFCGSAAIDCGIALVKLKDQSLVLARCEPGSPPTFLTFDLHTECAFRGIAYYSDAELLSGRRRHGGFWIPVTPMAFGAHLVRRIEKLQMDDARAASLSRLYAQDPAGCRDQITRFWQADSAAIIITAVRSGDWYAVRRSLYNLRAEMRAHAARRWTWRPVTHASTKLLRLIRSVIKPETGLIVALLGPDGAGKSSIIQALEDRLRGVFPRFVVHGFAPGILSCFHPPQGVNERPHAAPPRSYIVSVLRAVLYWFVYYQIHYRPVVHFSLAHSTLVIHDRHLIDAVVDPQRYRYSGPASLIRAIWRSIRQPNLIVLLDVPADVLQQRKQEVPAEESARQREAYRSLLETLPAGKLVDAGRPLNDVIGSVEAIILSHLAARVRSRLRFERRATCPNASPAMASHSDSSAMGN